MLVILKADPNPDFPRGTHERSIRIKKTSAEVADFAAARRVCLAFIAEQDLGSGNWTGGQIFEGDTQVAHVTYNGRVWMGAATAGRTEEIIITGGR